MAGAPIDALRSVSLFADLDDDELSQVALLFKLRRFAAGDTVVKEGADGAAFFLIEAGEATVSVRGAERAALGPGDHFGEIALIDWGRDFSYARTATVVATEPTELLALPAAALRELMAENPAVDRAIRRVARERIATR